MRGRGSRKAQTDGWPREDARGGGLAAAGCDGTWQKRDPSRGEAEVRGREDVRKRGKGAFLKLFLEKKRLGVIVMVSSSTNECTK